MKYLPSDEHNEREAALFNAIAEDDGGWFPYRSFTEFIDVKIDEKLEEMQFNALHWAITSLVDQNICNIFVVKEEILDKLNCNKIEFDIKEIMKDFWWYKKIECDNDIYYCNVNAEI